MRVAVLVALAVVVAAQVSAEEVPAPARALILLRVLAYDYQLPKRAGDTVRVAVIYRAGDGRSEAAATETAAALVDAAQHVSVAGRPVRVTSLPYTDGLDRELARAQAAAAYVCPGLSGQAAAIATATQKSQTLTFTDDAESVRAALSVGLVRRGDRAAILVNLVAARAEGADLSAALLRIAEVVKR